MSTTSLLQNDMIYRHSVKAEKGMRKYMEDVTQIDVEEFPIKTSFFAVFDGHGGREAAKFAKKTLWKNLKQHQNFGSNDPERFKQAIVESFLLTHKSMEDEIESWPKRKSGNRETNSTSGTTVTCAILRARTLYVAQLGDSGALIAKCRRSGRLEGKIVTIDHKPTEPSERKRIEELGGSVAEANGTHRVVWKRPTLEGNATNGPFVEVPFLAVSRSLGDLWSFNNDNKEYIVSPVPEITSYELKKDQHKFMILGTDGLWGMLTAKEAVHFVKRYREKHSDDCDVSSYLIRQALGKWKAKKLKADNISAIVVYFDEEGPSCNGSESSTTQDLFTTDEEETPTLPSSLPEPDTRLKRHNAHRWIDLDDLERMLKRTNTPADVETTHAKPASDDPERSLDLEEGDERSLKRKSPESNEIGIETSYKKSRTSTSTEFPELKTNVSSQSIAKLNLD